MINLLTIRERIIIGGVILLICGGIIVRKIRQPGEEAVSGAMPVQKGEP